MVASLLRKVGHVIIGLGQVSNSSCTFALHDPEPSNSGFAFEHADANRSTAARVSGWSYIDPSQAVKLGTDSVNVR